MVEQGRRRAEESQGGKGASERLIGIHHESSLTPFPKAARTDEWSESLGPKMFHLTFRQIASSL